MKNLNYDHKMMRRKIQGKRRVSTADGPKVLAYYYIMAGKSVEARA